MTIAVGDRLPDATFVIKTDDGPVRKTTREVFDGRKVVLFGVPGAFTPTCHGNHLPGFVEHAAAIRERGVDEIAVVAVNDMHVMRAWAQASGGEGKITFLSDFDASFAKAIGLDFDGSATTLGIRVRRFAAIVEDGTVTYLGVDTVPGQVTVTSAAAVLEKLSS
jgi:peroxiredoxin